MAWQLQLASIAEHRTSLYAAWHAAPPRCRGRLVAATAFYLGTEQYRCFVWSLELAVFGLALVIAFLAGRFTAGARLVCQSEVSEVQFSWAAGSAVLRMIPLEALAQVHAGGHAVVIHKGEHEWHERVVSCIPRLVVCALAGRGPSRRGC